MPVIFTQEWLGLSADLLNIITLVVGALLLLLVLWLIISAIRRPRFASSRRSRQARLAITDAALIDERRKLVLVRRDNVEHLVLIGGANDLVIESDIGAPTPSQSAGAPAQQAAPVASTPEPKPLAATPSAEIKPSEPAPQPEPVETPASPKPATAPVARAEPAPVAKPAVVTPTVAAPTPSVNPTAPNSPAVSANGPKVTVSQPQVTRNSETAKPTMGDNMDALLNRITDDKKG